MSIPDGSISLSISEAQHIALKLHRTGALPEAEALYRLILDVAPDTIDVLHFLAVLCNRTGRNEDARTLIEKIILLDPHNADAHNNLGNVLEGMGKIEEAEQCYRKALDFRPDHASALNNLAVSLMAQARASEAIETYQRAIALAPEMVDFRYNLAHALRKSDRLEEAITEYRKVLEINPGHQGACEGLARILIGAGRKQEAIETYDGWLRVDPTNEVALYMRSALVGEGVPPRTPDFCVRDMFDGVMAASFDRHLLDNLHYRAPDLLIEALSRELPPPGSQFDILDAGCGTGLCAPLLKPYARYLCGVDLSSDMLGMARETQQYHELVNGELSTFLAAKSGVYDIIASADTLCYFGTLDVVFRAAAKALKDQGLLALTLEDAGEEGSGWTLSTTGRYVHTRSYVEKTLVESGFTVLCLSSGKLRDEKGKPVVGHVVVARKITG